MTALERKADARPGGITALTNTGRSDGSNRPEFNGSLRPETDVIDCTICFQIRPLLLFRCEDQAAARNSAFRFLQFGHVDWRHINAALQ